MGRLSLSGLLRSANGNANHVAPVAQPVIAPAPSVAMVIPRVIDMSADELLALPLPEGSVSVFEDWALLEGKWVPKLSNAQVVFTTNRDLWQQRLLETKKIHFVPGWSAIQLQELGAAMWIAGHFDVEVGGRDVLDLYHVKGGFDWAYVFTARSNPLIGRIVAFNGPEVHVLNVQHKLNSNVRGDVVIEDVWAKPGFAQDGLRTRIAKLNAWLKANVDPDAEGVDANTVMTRWEAAAYLFDGHQLVIRQARTKGPDGTLTPFEDMRAMVTAPRANGKLGKLDHITFGYRQQAGRDCGLNYWLLRYGEGIAEPAVE